MRDDHRRLARVPHEQIPPSELLRTVQLAEQAGFDAAMSSDHFSPWSERQGESGFAWSWLGATMATTNLPFGVVTAPGQRYHPAIIAQAAATLSEMFPGRFWMALGSGEASNEHITGDRWPAKDVRTRRLAECVAVIRALLGEEVSHDGLVRVDRARLYTLPTQAPPLIGAAVSSATAEFAGSWADGLITVNQSSDLLREVLAAFDAGGGRDKPRYLQVHVSWADSDDEALTIAHDQWRSNVFSPPVCWDLELTRTSTRRRVTCGREDMHEGGSDLVRSGPSVRSARRTCRARLRWRLDSPCRSASRNVSSKSSVSTSYPPSAGRGRRRGGREWIGALMLNVPATADLWWKNAIIYCLDVQTFADSDGDGIGDFGGLTQHVDDLAGLGVTCIWLMPFYPTADRDDGYDITDHYAIDPRSARSATSPGSWLSRGTAGCA